MDNKQFLDNLMWRYATKKFDSSKKLSSDQLSLIEESLRLAPSSYGIQPWKFYLIEDITMRERIKEAAYGQSQITDASNIFVLASKIGLSDKDIEVFIKEISETRGVAESDLDEHKNTLLGFISGKSQEWLDNWSARQLYIALGFGLMSAAQNNIDACPMEGFDPDKVSELIGAKQDGYQVKSIMALGFRSPDDSYASLKKVRFSKEKVIKII